MHSIRNETYRVYNIERLLFGGTFNSMHAGKSILNDSVEKLPVRGIVNGMHTGKYIFNDTCAV